MKVVVIDWDLCKKECCDICEGAFDGFMEMIEMDELSLLISDDLNHRWDKMLEVAKTLCPKNAISFVPFVGGD